MNKQSKIQAIREWCILANPSILDLKFGCKTAEYSDKYDLYVGKNEVEDEYYFISIDKIGCEDQQFYVEGTPKPKIIGREITLADIFIAMEIDEDDGSDESLQDKVTTLAYMWNKYEDNLENQEESTLDFLLSLKQ